jgi:hypothetical protein
MLQAFVTLAGGTLSSRNGLETVSTPAGILSFLTGAARCGSDGSTILPANLRLAVFAPPAGALPGTITLFPNDALAFDFNGSPSIKLSGNFGMRAPGRIVLSPAGGSLTASFDLGNYHVPPVALSLTSSGLALNALAADIPLFVAREVSFALHSLQCPLGAGGPAACAATLAVTASKDGARTTAPLTVVLDGNGYFSVPAGSTLAFGRVALRFLKPLALRVSRGDPPCVSLSGGGTVTFSLGGGPSPQSSPQPFMRDIRMTEFWIGYDPSKPAANRSCDENVHGNLRYDGPIVAGLLKIDSLGGSFDSEPIPNVKDESRSVLKVNLDATATGIDAGPLTGFGFDISNAVITLPLDGSRVGFGFTGSVQNVSGRLFGRSLDPDGCDQKSNEKAFQFTGTEIGICARVHMNAEPLGSSDLATLKATVENVALGSAFVPTLMSAEITQADPISLRVGDRFVSARNVDLVFDRALRERMCTHRTAQPGCEKYGDAVAAAARSDPQDAAQAGDLSGLSTVTESDPGADPNGFLHGQCIPVFHGTMELSLAGILYAKQETGDQTFQTSFGTGDECFYLSANGVVHFNLSPKASAVVRTVEIGRAPSNIDADAAQHLSPAAIHAAHQDHLKLSGDLYIDTVVLSFDQLGFHHDDARHADNRVWAVPNGVKSLTATAANNVSTIFGFLGGLISRAFVH